ncbi:MAG: class I SAM-dependent methyltransferase [Pirellulaceae bacterium]
MPSALSYLPLIFGQNIGPQLLARTPEPDNQVVTDSAQSVAEYDQVMKTKLAISYALAIETIFRTRSSGIESAIDIACGPGHLSINMARDLGIKQLVGVDLSEEMIRTASANAEKQNSTNVCFEPGDATALRFESDSFDLCTMMDAAHHLPTLDAVSTALCELDRVCKPNGHVVVMDLVRLRSHTLTEKYVNLVGHENVEFGLTDFLKQFRDSMYAAWTPSELASAVPKLSSRKWVSIVPVGLPFAQFLLGLPAKQVSSIYPR